MDPRASPGGALAQPPHGPFGGSGARFIREGIRSVEELALSETVKRKIYETNAERLLTPVKEE